MKLLPWLCFECIWRSVLGRSCLLLFLLGIYLNTSILRSQDPLRFEDEIRDLLVRNDSIWDAGKPTLIFTGSSSIRMWEDLQSRFPDNHILNNGFGGSQASDLLFYLKPLVLEYKPKRVFIYEGDNDLAEGKTPEQALSALKEITLQIHTQFPGVPIVLIGAKPSISRWNLRKKYGKFNRKLARYTEENSLLHFVDVWDPMLTGGELDESLFIEDGLHMKPEGYDIWQEVLQPYIASNPKNP